MKKLLVEIADNPTSLANGLMHRKHLASNSGMLFKFHNPMSVSFWGKNTYIPLDVAFVGPDLRIAEIKSITPMSTRTVTSSIYCLMAIEANAGYFKNNEIHVGDKISISTDKSNEAEVIFE